MPQLLDTHQHLLYPDRFGYSWTDGIPPLANQGFEVEKYADLTSGKGIGGAIFMETGIDDVDYQDETRFAAELAANSANKIVGIIASCRPEENEGFDAWLEECTDFPVVGYRRVLHVVPDDMSKSETFRSNVRKLGDSDLTFDLCYTAAQLPIAVELANACDNTQLILNHCGVPDIAGGGLDPWRAHISELAKSPNVVCKVSGVLAYCAPGTASKEPISPYVDHVVNAFGTDRLVWGSDWPVVNLANGVADWIDIFRDILSGLSIDEAEKVANSTASRIYSTSL